MIRHVCTYCSAIENLQDGMAGEKIQCGKCQKFSIAAARAEPGAPAEDLTEDEADDLYESDQEEQARLRRRAKRKWSEAEPRCYDVLNGLGVLVIFMGILSGIAAGVILVSVLTARPDDKVEWGWTIFGMCLAGFFLSLVAGNLIFLAVDSARNVREICRQGKSK